MLEASGVTLQYKTADQAAASRACVTALARTR